MNPANPSSTQLRQPVRWKRYWWVVALGAVAGLLLGTQLSRLQPLDYRSETSVLVLPALPAQDFGAAGGRTETLNLETEARLVKSVEVADAVQDLLPTNTSAEAQLSRVDVLVTENSQVLTIAYNGTSPEDARDTAQAFGDAYLTLRTNEAQAEVDRTADVLQLS